MQKENFYTTAISEHSKDYLKKAGKVGHPERSAHVENFMKRLGTLASGHADESNHAKLAEAFQDLGYLASNAALMGDARRDATHKLFVKTPCDSDQLFGIGLRNFKAAKLALKRQFGKKATGRVNEIDAAENRWRAKFTGKPGYTYFVTQAPFFFEIQDGVFAHRIKPHLPNEVALAVEHAIRAFRSEEPHIHEELRKLREEGSN